MFRNEEEDMLQNTTKGNLETLVKFGEDDNVAVKTPYNFSYEEVKEMQPINKLQNTKEGNDCNNSISAKNNCIQLASNEVDK